MSEIEDLSDIAEQTAFGTGRMPTGHHHHRPAAKQGRCGSPDHMKGENVRVYRKGKKLRTLCKLCDRARRHRYSAQGYPL